MSTDPGERAVATVLDQITEELRHATRGRTDLDSDVSLVGLGVDSIAVFEFLQRVESRYGVRLPLGEVLSDSGTLRHLAGQISAAPAVPAEDRSATAARPEDPSGVATVHPLSRGQRESWFLSQLGDDESRVFNEVVALDLRGPLDVVALSAAAKRLVHRHESLRSVVEPDGSGQYVMAEGPALRVHEALDAPVTSLLLDAASHVFDLRRGPLVQADLYALSRHRHLLVLSSHDVVLDGTSFQVLLAELGALYGAARAGRPEGLPPAVPLGELARQRERYCGSEQSAIDERYWRNVVEGGLPQVPSGTVALRAGPVSADSTGHPTGAAVHQRVDGPRWDRWGELARRAGVTPFTAMFAAWTALLHEVTGAEELTVFTPVAIGPAADGRRVVGSTVTMVPIRSTWRGGSTLANHLGDVRCRLLDAFDHAAFPVSSLLPSPHRDATSGHWPTGQHTLMFNHFAEREPVAFDGLQVLDVPVPKPYPAGLLDARVRAVADGALLTVSFPVARVDESFVEVLGDRFGRLLDTLGGAASTTVSEWVAATHAHVAGTRPVADDSPPQVVGKAPSAPTSPTVLRLFEAVARSTPDVSAVVDGGTHVSYAELDAWAGLLAAQLRRAGVGAEEPVGLLFDRSAAMVAALLGTWKAAATAVPLNVEDPASRRADIMHDAHVQRVMTTQARAGELPVGRQVTVVDDGPPLNIGRSERSATAQPRGGAAAYVVHTSGSSGRPKGVVVTHAGLAATFHAWDRAFDLRVGSAVHTQMANPAFDGFMGEAARALGSGSTLLVVPRDVLIDAARLADLLTRHDVSVADFVAPALRSLAACIAAGAATVPSSLRLLIVGSDVTRTEELMALRRGLGPRVVLVNAYGVSECTVDSTVAVFEPGDEEAAEVLIGRPLPGVQVHVLDQGGEPVREGAVGVLHVGGPSLARGYLDDPARTAGRFVPHPTAAGQRLYRTGDLVRWVATRSGPQLQFLGREDEQTSVRGYRVELGEVAAAVHRLPGVADATVVVVDRPASALVAHVQLASGCDEATVGDWRTALREWLPAYMVPARLVLHERLPLTANGKIDRARLATGLGGREVQPTDRRRARTATQQRLALLWSRALQSGQDIGADDHFFDVGGDSLLLMHVLGAIRQEWGVEVGVGEFLDNPILSALADVVDAHVDGGSRTSPVLLPSITRAEREVVDDLLPQDRPGGDGHGMG